MAWTDGDLKIFAAGLAVSNKWNSIGGGGTFALRPPIASPPPGNYPGQILSVTLSSDVQGAVIRLTTNGKLPTATQKEYDGSPIVIGDDTTILAYAQVNNLTSKIAKYKYGVYNPLAHLHDEFKCACSDSMRDSDCLISTKAISINLTDTFNSTSVCNFTDSAYVFVGKE